MEVTHSPTGCMLIKRSVIDKMIEAYPEKSIVQKTVINGEYVDKPHMWNFLTRSTTQRLRLILEKTSHSVSFGKI